MTVDITGGEGGASDDAAPTPRGTVGGVSVAVTVIAAEAEGARSDEITCISLGTLGPGSVEATTEPDGVVGSWLTAWNPVGEDGMF